MKHVELKSSNLKSAGYDTKTNTLEVIFHNGSTYRYEQVENAIFKDLISAKSPGSYFNYIKNRLNGKKV